MEETKRAQKPQNRQKKNRGIYFHYLSRKEQKTASIVPLSAATEENKRKRTGGYAAIEHDKDREKKDLLIMCVLRQLKGMELEELRRVYATTCDICDSKKKSQE